MAVLAVLVTGLGSAALWLWATPPEGQATVARAAALTCVLGLVLVGALVGRSTGSARSRRHLGTAVAITALTAFAVDAVRVAAGLSGPWPQQELLAVVVVAAAALWWGARGAALMTVPFVALLVAPAATGATDRSLTVTVVTSAVAGVRLVLVGLGLAALTAVARGLVRASDAAAGARADALLDLEAARSAASVAAETQRSLHDTALNTLEVVARAPSDGPQPAIVARCRRDIAVLTAAMTPGARPEPAVALRSVAAEAGALGLRVDCRFSPDVPWDVLPPAVLDAVVGAVREALGNVAKHADVADAELTAAPGPGGGVRVVVADHGVGRSGAARTEAGSGGFGVGESVVRRMSDAGGRARVEDGPAGGTLVTLDWSPAPHPEPRRTTEGFDRDVARLVLIATWALTLVSLAAIGLGAASFTAPASAVVGVLLPAVWVSVLAVRVRDGTAIRVTDVVAGGLVLVAATVLAVPADPYCSSIVGEGGLPDARLVLLVALLVWRPRPGTWALEAVSILAATGLTASLWHRRWADCGQQTLALGLAELLLVTFVWAAVRVLGRQARDLTRLEESALAARLAVRRERAGAAERRRWSDVLVAAAVEELTLVAGSGGVLDATRRQRAGQTAGLLRALLTVGPSPDPLPATLRQWLGRRLRDATSSTMPSMEVRGSVSWLRPPVDVVESIRRCLHRLEGHEPDSVVLVGWSGASAQGISIRAVATTTDWLPAPHTDEAWACEPDAEDDVAGDVTWTWPSPAWDATDEDSPSVASRS